MRWRDERAGVAHPAGWQYAIGLALLAMTLTAIYRRRPGRALSAAMLLCLVPCIASTGWKHHFLILILPYAALAATWDRQSRVARALFISSAICSTIRMPELIGGAASLWLAERSVALVAALSAWCGLMVVSSSRPLP